MRAFLLFAIVALAGCRAENPQVEIKTNLGTIKAELFVNEAPVTVKNFLSYVEKKYYDGLTFHRVIPNFMIQGGGFKPGDMEEEVPTDSPIKNEASNGLKNDRGTLAMARTPEPDSATSQFFINVVDNPVLNRSGTTPDKAGYAVFGKVFDGVSVVDKIRRVPTHTVKTSKGAHGDVPINDVVIESIRVIPK